MLEALSRFVVRRRVPLVTLFVILTAISAVLMPGVNVNCDMTAYLPQEMDTTISLQLMEDTFGASGMAQIMVEGLSLDETASLKGKIAEVEGVQSVVWLDDFEDIRTPLAQMEAGNVASYYRDGKALLTVQFDAGDYEDRTRAAVSRIRQICGEEAAMRGSAVTAGLMIEAAAEEIITIVLWVVPVALIILLLTTSSLAEALLFLVVLMMAVLINMGTNIFLPSISFMTQLSVAVLQMAISMDYSIFLLDRFAEERAAGLSAEEAMKNAVAKAFRSISASSTTTIAGFVALMFMRYTIGFDMGLVLAKGIVISLLSILFVLPGMAMLCVRFIDKTQHKKLLPAFTGWGKFVISSRKVCVVLWLLLVVPCFLAQNMNTFAYGESAVMSSEGSRLDEDAKRIEAVYGSYNPMVLIAPTQELGAERVLAEKVAAIDGVSSVQTLANVLPVGMPAAIAGDEVIAQFQQDGWTRYLLTLDSHDESARARETVAQLKAFLKDAFAGQRWGLVGGATSVADIKEVVESDYTTVNWMSIGMVAIILILTFRSLVLPLVLILVIESSIWVNMSVPYFTGDTLSFIGYMIVSSIQLGATIDYAILLADRYRELRADMDKREAAREAVRRSGGSILTSAGILTACGMTVYALSSIGGIRQLGLLIGRGAAMSGLFVLLIAPQLLMLVDRFVLARKKKAGNISV